MAAVDYVSLIDAIEATISDALEDVYVTQDESPPTAEQCPAVIVCFDGFERTPTRIAMGYAPYDEHVAVSLYCYAFSGQSAFDARRQRDKLVRSVIDALMANPTLNQTALIFQVLRGTPLSGQNDGIHNGMQLVCDALLQS